MTFAYISDCVVQKERAPAYGLALATFGLSFCIGPLSGGFFASIYGNRSVFLISGLLLILDISYILMFLPESAKNVRMENEKQKNLRPHRVLNKAGNSNTRDQKFSFQRVSNIVLDISINLTDKSSIAYQNLPNSHEILEPFQLFWLVNLIFIYVFLCLIAYYVAMCLCFVLMNV